MLLRAAMVRDSIIAIDRPFKIMPDVEDDRFIHDALQRIYDSFKKCFIFDYIWFKERYKTLNI